MKKIFYFFIFNLFICTSCKKNSASPNYSTGTISANIDGKTVLFNFNALAMRSGDDTLGVYALRIWGYEGVPGTGAALSLTIGGTHPIGPGNYVFGNVSNYVSIGFSPQTDSVQFTNTFDTINPCVITLRFLTPNDIQGTFSGKLTLTNGIYPETTKTVTDGKFSVKIL